MNTMGTPQLQCPLCQATEFQQEEGRLDSRWGITSHRMTLMVCVNCRFVLHFYDKHSIFDFD
jgi:predicted nucleic-acid-binding Zn-ribbon protein